MHSMFGSILTSSSEIIGEENFGFEINIIYGRIFHYLAVPKKYYISTESMSNSFQIYDSTSRFKAIRKIKTHKA